MSFYEYINVHNYTTQNGNRQGGWGQTGEPQARFTALLGRVRKVPPVGGGPLLPLPRKEGRVGARRRVWGAVRGTGEGRPQAEAQ